MGSYDIIIAGAGAAGLLLADALGNDPYFRKHSILLLEKDPIKGNDRTWCFWEAGKGAFDPIIHASWDRLHFSGQSYSASFPIAPYTYKMLKGTDFYREYHKRLNSYPNLSLKTGMVTSMKEVGEEVLVYTSQGNYSGKMVFNSLFSWKDLKTQSRYPVLQQHFMGWFIRSETPVFEAGTATFMDFSIGQHGNTRFMYVLPFSDREALVEYTLFSGELLPDAEYEAALEHYIRHKLGCSNYRVLEREKGQIPMSCHDFTTGNTDRILHIGTAGGWAKPSTGYTFMNTYRNTAALLQHLREGKRLSSFGTKTRFWWYDLLLLDILARDNGKGRQIFEALFSQRKAPLILKFLDEQTTIWEDIRVIMACPKKDFIISLLNRLTGRTP